MKKLAAALLFFIFASAAAHAQTAGPWPDNVTTSPVTDFGNGPLSLRVIKGNVFIFTGQGSGVGSTSGASTSLALTATPSTAPCVGCVVSGTGILTGTTVAAYSGTRITLSAAMTVASGTAVSWGAACPTTYTSPYYIQGSVGAGYWPLYTEARVCAVSPGASGNFAVRQPILYDQTVAGIAPAPPTALVGPTRTVGVLPTFISSDSAPAINLTSTYPWTGTHSISPSSAAVSALALNPLNNSLGQGLIVTNNIMAGTDDTRSGIFANSFSILNDAFANTFVCAFGAGSCPANGVVQIVHDVGGNTVRGGRQSLSVGLALVSPTAGNPFPQYVAASALAQTLSGITAGLDNALYGFNPGCALFAGTTIGECTAGEADLTIGAGVTVTRLAGWNINSIIRSRATLLEGALVIGNGLDSSGSPGLGAKNGILISCAFNTPLGCSQPVGTDGTLFATEGTWSVTNAFDISSITTTSCYFKTPNGCMVKQGNQTSGVQETIDYLSEKDTTASSDCKNNGSLFSRPIYTFWCVARSFDTGMNYLQGATLTLQANQNGMYDPGTGGGPSNLNGIAVPLQAIGRNLVNNADVYGINVVTTTLTGLTGTYQKGIEIDSGGAATATLYPLAIFISGGGSNPGNAVTIAGTVTDTVEYGLAMGGVRTAGIYAFGGGGTMVNFMDLSAGSYSGSAIKLGNAAGVVQSVQFCDNTVPCSAAGSGFMHSDAGNNLIITAPSGDTLALQNHGGVSRLRVVTAGVIIDGTMIMDGATSGTVTIAPQAVAGTPTITWPNASGTVAVSASSPLVLSATTGNLTCPTCATSSGGGAITGTSPISVSAAGVVSLDAAGVTYAKIQNLGALAVMGRSANSSGVGADIQATAASDAVLRESGSTVGFGTVATGGIANAAITHAKFQNLGALAVVGRSANSSGVGADIQASAASDAVLRESGSVVGFGTIATGGIANNAVTLAKLATQATNTVLGNATAGSAVPTALSMTSCSTTASAVTWTTSTGFGCNAGVAVTSKVISSSRDLTTASGSQAVTGFGFTPSSCEVFGAINGGTTASYTTYFGHSDSALAQHSMFANGAVLSFNTGIFLFAADATGGNVQSAVIASYAADTVNLTWTKGGSPTGTFLFSLRCFK